MSLLCELMLANLWQILNRITFLSCVRVTQDFPGHSVLLLFLNVDSIGPISHICEWLNPQSDVGSEHANSFLQFQNESGEAQRKGKKL